MILAAGVILLQLSGLVPPETIADAKATVLPAEVSATNSNKGGTLPGLENIKLTSLNFADTSDSSAAEGTNELDASQDSVSIPPMHLPQIKPKKHDVIRVEGKGSRLPWLVLMAAQHGAAALDAYSTRYAVGHGAVEENPLLRPFVHSDSIYVVSQVAPAVLDLLGRRIERSQNGLIRRMWWLPQTLSTGTYIWAGAHNLQLAGNR
jgi:hypothetical protein